MTGSTILDVAYGLTPASNNDPYIVALEKGVHPAVVASIPGTYLVDFFPVLKYVPEWMPFATFKRQGKSWRRDTEIMINMPFEATKHNLACSLNLYDMKVLKI